MGVLDAVAINSMNQTQLIKTGLLLIIAILIIGGGYLLYHFGYLAGKIYGQNQELLLAQQQQNQLIEEIFGNMAASSLIGRVTKINIAEKSINVIVPSIMGVNIPKIYQNKNLLIKDGVAITLKENKTAEAFNKELAEYQAKARKTRGMMSVSPPLPFSEKGITINDLKTGDNITFTFNNPAGKSAILLSEITPTQISVQR